MEDCCKHHSRWCFVSFDGDYPPEPCCPGCSANRYPNDPLWVGEESTNG